jgi:tRNA(Arg) A34 adenosine deaminase TadA
MPDLDTLDHERHVERACALARESAENGDDPFGSLLVHGGAVVQEAHNEINTEDDIALHPEMTLARWAARELGADASEAVLYTSTEPCSMCATALAYAGVNTVVYSVSGARAAELRGEGASGIPSTEVFERHGVEPEVVGPVRQEEGEAVHREYPRRDLE